MEGVKARLQVSTTPDGDRRLLTNLLRIVRTLGLTRGLYRGISSRSRAPDALRLAVFSGRAINVMDGRSFVAGWLPTALCRMTNWAYFGKYWHDTPV